MKVANENPTAREVTDACIEACAWGIQQVDLSEYEANILSTVGSAMIFAQTSDSERMLSDERQNVVFDDEGELADPYSAVVGFIKQEANRYIRIQDLPIPRPSTLFPLAIGANVLSTIDPALCLWDV